jgi:hypothetical protein
MNVNFWTELETVEGEDGKGVDLHVAQAARDCVVRIARRN